jgi:hypothetical protein
MTATVVTNDLPECVLTENDNVWRFSRYLSNNNSGSSVDRYAIVILNQPLRTRHFNVLWSRGRSNTVMSIISITHVPRYSHHTILCRWWS